MGDSLDWSLSTPMTFASSAEATASRGVDPSKPSVSPREWAQTAAVGIALRNAGFGLQFGAAGDEYSPNAPNELNIVIDPVPVSNGNAMGEVGQYSAPIPIPSEPPKELTPEEKYQMAANMQWPTKKHAGRTLGEVLQMDPTAITWLANKYSGNPEISAAAKFMCEFAVSHTGA